MPLIDRVGGRRMLVWATVLQVAGLVPFVLFEVSFLAALVDGPRKELSLPGPETQPLCVRA